jgi:hypothetical protein
MAEEKFKARLLRDLDPEEKESFEKIEYYWIKHPIIINYHGIWREYIAYFEGDQYLFYNKISNRLEDVTPWLEREVYTVINRILPMVRQVWGEIRYKHEFKVDPNTFESEDIKAAKLGSMLIEFLNNKTNFLQKISLAKLWALIAGDCYWKIWWNKNLKGMTLNKDREAVAESGEVDQNLVIPFNFRPDPDVSGQENWRWAMEGKRLPASIVEEEFGLEPKSIEPDPKDKYDSGLFERMDQEKSREDTVIRIEYHEKASRKYPKGRFMVKAGNYYCYNGDSPSPNGDLPYFDLPGILPILGEDQHDSLVRLGQTEQRQINRMASCVDGHIQNYHIKAMIPQGSLIGEELDAFTRAGVDYVVYNPMGAGTPFWQTPAPLAPIIMDWLNFHVKEIDAETSVRDASLARIPKYGTRASGTLFERLTGQDQKVLLPGLEEQDQVLGQAMTFMLRVAIKNYTMPRMIKITGRDKRTSIEAIKGADLRDNTDIVVTPGIDLFANRGERQEVVMTFVEKGLLQDKREALQLMDMKGIETFMEDEFIDERQAFRENDKMREGRIYPEPSEDDNSEVHLKIHGNEKKKEDYELWSKESKTMMERHLAATKEILKPKPVPAQAPAAITQPAVGIPPPGAAAGLPVPALAGTAPMGAPVAAPPPAGTPEELALLAQMIEQGQGGGGVPAPAGGM